MSQLLRTQSGNFYLKDSIKIEQLDDFINNDRLYDVIMPIEKVLEDYKKFIVLEKANKFLYNGNKISLNYIKNSNKINENEKILIYDEKNNLIGIYQVLEDYIKPLTILL